MDISLVAPGFAVGGPEDFYMAVVGAEAGAYVLVAIKEPSDNETMTGI